MAKNVDLAGALYLQKTLASEWALPVNPQQTSTRVNTIEQARKPGSSYRFAKQQNSERPSNTRERVCASNASNASTHPNKFTTYLGRESFAFGGRKRMVAFDRLNFEGVAVSLRRHQRGEAGNRLMGKELAPVEFENQSGYEIGELSSGQRSERLVSGSAEVGIRMSQKTEYKLTYLCTSGAPAAHADAMQICRDRSNVLRYFAHEHKEVAVDISSCKKFAVVQERSGTEDVVARRAQAKS
ncbi:hypothetical protein C8R45DRAFT_943524 [Mycena sanguinolenta]|nr:hypothetical protein C8R45DRAFT_943524 [Mycena sanguinolenta]